MAKQSKNKESAREIQAQENSRLPFIPKRWPSEKEFQAAFAKAYELRRKERDGGLNEDGPSLYNPYQTRFEDTRLTSRLSRIN